MGVNAVVGILISAFYMPIWTSSIIAPIDFALAAILFLACLLETAAMDYRDIRCNRWIIVRNNVRVLTRYKCY